LVHIDRLIFVIIQKDSLIFNFIQNYRFNKTKKHNTPESLDLIYKLKIPGSK